MAETFSPVSPSVMQRRKRAQLRRRRLFILSLGVLASFSLLMGGCSQPPAKTTQQSDGSQTIKIIVKSGFHPARIQAMAGRPLKLEFFRDEDPTVHSCDQDVNIPAENVNLHLPVHESQIVEIKPQAKGDLVFQCGMQMFKGKVSFE